MALLGRRRSCDSCGQWPCMENCECSQCVKLYKAIKGPENKKVNGHTHNYMETGRRNTEYRDGNKRYMLLSVFYECMNSGCPRRLDVKVSRIEVK